MVMSRRRRRRFHSRWSSPIQSSADAVLTRVIFLLVWVLVAANVRPAMAQAASAPDLKTLIGNLSSLDYATRMNAARLVRRTPAAAAVPILVDAVRRHPDE